MCEGSPSCCSPTARDRSFLRFPLSDAERRLVSGEIARRRRCFQNVMSASGRAGTSANQQRWQSILSRTARPRIENNSATR